GVILLNQDSEILLINPAARFLLNLSEGQYFYERPFNEVVRIPDLSRAVNAAGNGDGPQKVLVEIPTTDSIRPVKARVDRFSAAGHKNLLMTLRDETEAHRLEEMRREFVANISHELKTPLAAIKGYAETVELAIKDDPEAASYFMTQIQSQCKRLERLIADMMQLARAQSGRGNMRITTVSLPDVISESIQSYVPVAEAKRIDLTVDLAEPVTARAEQEAVLTITNNLIGNAIHYTPEGGTVRVSCVNDKETCVLAVEDTGVGIPESEHKRIFERFYRVEKNRSSSDGGTGIGLSVVKNLAVALGGEVRVESKPGEGARFEVRLPRTAS
ncbi:MAG: ATP-binding protein, partial [Planctomycetota bacterium]